MQFQFLLPVGSVHNGKPLFSFPVVEFFLVCQKRTFLNPGFGRDRLLKFLTISQIRIEIRVANVSVNLPCQ